MIGITDKAKCCGCGACMQACPKSCITMLPDEEGFLYPNVDTNVCVKCGLCEKVCPVLNSENGGDNVLKTLVGYQTDLDTRLSSSSGGIFSLLADYVLSKNGKVYGAAFDENYEVHHIGIVNADELRLLQGSKYTQSGIEQAYQHAKSDLDAGHLVLFSGVACQIAGLKQFLRHDYSNLITVDVLCHGVPSPMVWKKYMSSQSTRHNAKISGISFRKKNHGWKNYEVELVFSNGEVYHKPFYQDTFMRLFLSNICLRPSCHQCSFKMLERCSDITLGDCWGIQEYMPEMDDDNGTSVILIHTERAQKIIDELAFKLNCRQVETMVALPPTADSRKSVRQHPKRSQFFIKLDKVKDIDETLKMLRPSVKRRIVAKLKRLKSEK